MMKPVVYVSLGLFTLVYMGNACMRSGFSTQQTNDLGIQFNSCSADESTLNRPALNDSQIGYIGDRMVSYSNVGEDLIMMEGDMLVPVKGGALPSKPLPKGIAQGVGVPTGSKWPNGIIPYKIPAGFSERYRIDEAVQHWNNNMEGVITFVPWTNQANYASIIESSAGCSSVVGFQNRGAHEVSISTQCSTGNVIHELGHIIGLQHEQNRLDRDQYVTVNYTRIQPGYEGNFTVNSSFVNYMYYDFGSIMHYALNAFSTDGADTISPRVQIPSSIVVGQRVALSLGDINSARAIYGANAIASLPGTSTTTTTTTTATGGTGVAGSYYQRTDFIDLRMSTLDGTIDFNWGKGAPISRITGASFSAKWRGWIVPPTSGDYKFVIISSGAFRVTMDSTKVFENLLNKEANQYLSKAYTLTGNQKVRLVTEYIATGLENQIQLRWIKPDGTEEVIPQANLVPDPAALSEMSNLCTLAAASR